MISQQQRRKLLEVRSSELQHKELVIVDMISAIMVLRDVFWSYQVPLERRAAACMGRKSKVHEAVVKNRKTGLQSVIFFKSIG